MSEFFFSDSDGFNVPMKNIKRLIGYSHLKNESRKKYLKRKRRGRFGWRHKKQMMQNPIGSIERIVDQVTGLAMMVTIQANGEKLVDICN